MIRVYHPKANNSTNKCHMFDIENSHYTLWRGGGVGLSSEFVLFPNGSHPDAFSSIQCGTCKTTYFKLDELTFEPSPK